MEQMLFETWPIITAKEKKEHGKSDTSPYSLNQESTCHFCFYSIDQSMSCDPTYHQGYREVQIYQVLTGNNLGKALKRTFITF